MASARENVFSPTHEPKSPSAPRARSMPSDKEISNEIPTRNSVFKPINNENTIIHQNPSNLSRSQAQDNLYEGVSQTHPPIHTNPQISNLTEDPVARAVTRINVALNRNERINPTEVIDMGQTIQTSNKEVKDRIDLLEESYNKLQQQIKENQGYDPLLNLNQHFSVKPPTKFGHIPKFTNDKARDNLIKSTPGFAQKFTGNKKNDQRTLTDHLRNIIRWHLSFEDDNLLTLKEFVICLENTFDGQARHTIVNTMERKGLDLYKIFRALYKNYDYGPSAADARIQLLDFKITKKMTINKAAIQVAALAERASMDLDDDEQRDTQQELDSLNVLQRALPPKSSRRLTIMHTMLKNKLKRKPDLDELLQALDHEEAEINEDIRENGENEVKKGKKGNKNLSINAIIAANTDDATNAPPPPQNTQNPTQATNNAPKPKRKYTRKPKDAGAGSNNKPNDQNKARKNTPKPKPKNVNNKRNQNKRQNNNSCYSCGKCDHISIDCTYIRNDKGEILDPIPCFDYCGDCPDFLGQRLRHREQYCPFRPKGIFTLLLKTGKADSPTKAKAKKKTNEDKAGDKDSQD